MSFGADPAARRRRPEIVLWVVAAAAGIAVFLPTFSVGFLLDDYHHLAILEDADPASGASAVDLWSWADGGVTTLFAADPQGGWLPWFAADDLRIRFLRPLTAAVHAADHALYGRRVAGWRVTTLVLWLLMLLAVGRLYLVLGRRAGAPPWLAPLALLLFAVDDCHAWNLGWLATRHSLIAGILAVTTVLLYLAWRAGRGGRFGALAAAAFAAALAGGENAVATVAWLLAYELFLASDRAAVRFARVAPFVGLAAAYAALHRALGYGVAGMTWYSDPLAAPFAYFVHLLPGRALVLLIGLLTPIPPEAALLGPGHATAAGIALLAVVAVALAAVLGRRPVARFLAAAVGLSLPVAAIPPPLSYMLLLPSVAAMWLVAAFLVDCWSRVWERRLTPAVVASGGVAVLLAVSHLGLAPRAAVAGVRTLAELDRLAAAMVAGAEVGATGVSADGRVVVLTTGDPLATIYLPLSWRMIPVPGERLGPAAVWVVSSAAGRHRLERTAEATFELSLPGAGEGASVWDRMVGDPAAIRVGERRRHGGMAVTVLAAGGGRLQRVSVELDRPLDAPTVHLLAWDGERLARVVPPTIGQDVTVGPHPLVELLRRRAGS